MVSRTFNLFSCSPAYPLKYCKYAYVLPLIHNISRGIALILYFMLILFFYFFLFPLLSNGDVICYRFVSDVTFIKFYIFPRYNLKETREPDAVETRDILQKVSSIILS